MTAISINHLYANLSMLALAVTVLVWPVIAATQQNESQSPGKEKGNNADRIKPYDDNPYYWQYKGKPVLLVGGSAQDNLFNHPTGLKPGGSLEAHLDLLVSVGGNYVRNTMSHRNKGNVFPFKRLSNGRFDLNRPNEIYWQRFEDFLSMTEQRNLIVQIEVWATYDYDGRGPNDGEPERAGWVNHPFNPANNVNYSEQNSRLLAGFDGHPMDNHFFQTTPGRNDDSVVLSYQQAFVDKLLSYSLEYSHVLYTMNNETWLEPEWAEYWINYVRSKAAQRGKEIETTDMASRPEDFRLLNQVDQPGLYTFMDVSQNNRGPLRTQDGWDQLVLIRDTLADSPRPLNNTKVYGGEAGGQSGTVEQGLQKFWRNLMAGCASARFHRDPWGLGLTANAQGSLSSVGMFLDEMNIFSAEPSNDLLSSRESNEVYLLAEAGKQYALYFPAGGMVMLDLSDAKGELKLKWLDIASSKWTQEQILQGGKKVLIDAPDADHHLALILKK